MKLQDEIKNIKGIGPKKASALNVLGIKTIGDLLSFYPRTYEDRRNLKQISEVINGEMAVIHGSIKLVVKGKYNRRNKQTLKLLIEDDSGRMEVIFFQAAYLEKIFSREKEYEFFGKINREGGKVSMLHPEFSLYTGQTETKILPIYPLTNGLSQKDMRKWQEVVSPFIQELPDFLPLAVIEKNKLCNYQYAVKNIHFPTDVQRLKEAKYRLIFDELFLIRAGLLYIKNQNQKQGKGIAFTKRITTEEFTSQLPYPLTKAQQRVLQEIEQDMESERVMNRLIQGDVGSGKTAVAAAALYKAVESGYQAVLMAPTELLARQHYEGLTKDFASFGIKTAFLSGSLGTKEKKTLLQELEDGAIDILIGTHAIIQPGVQFSCLGLVITDEQHRFGVQQRELLSAKGENPDVLVMTATPIPRTLAVILYGDLDISMIDELPPGRQTIITKATDEQGRDAAYTFLKQEIQQGRQCYIVAPLIADSENLEVRSAESLYQEIQDKWPQYNVAILHGAMKQTEKDAVMEQFYQGKVHILVSTVVIEVGINVPNATVMVIENAERFGLAQLHQLRGRVGRGKEQSYCILITKAQNDVAAQRMETMVDTSDGFLIAEKDLYLRGPGEFFGIRQHGLPELKLADLSKHTKILKKASEEANSILQTDLFLQQKQHKLLKNKIEEMFGNVENVSI